MSESAYQLAKDISDTLTKMERDGTPARYVIAHPDSEAYARAVAATRRELEVRVMPLCPRGQLFLMTAPPGDSFDLLDAESRPVPGSPDVDSGGSPAVDSGRTPA